jgi:hypothetical protein
MYFGRFVHFFSCRRGGTDGVLSFGSSRYVMRVSLAGAAAGTRWLSVAMATVVACRVEWSEAVV